MQLVPIMWRLHAWLLSGIGISSNQAALRLAEARPNCCMLRAAWFVQLVPVMWRLHAWLLSGIGISSNQAAHSAKRTAALQRYLTL